jgi:hypothetical protein
VILLIGSLFQLYFAYKATRNGPSPFWSVSTIIMTGSSSFVHSSHCVLQFTLQDLRLVVQVIISGYLSHLRRKDTLGNCRSTLLLCNPSPCLQYCHIQSVYDDPCITWDVDDSLLVTIHLSLNNTMKGSKWYRPMIVVS